MSSLGLLANPARFGRFQIDGSFVTLQLGYALFGGIGVASPEWGVETETGKGAEATLRPSNVASMPDRTSLMRGEDELF